MQEQGFFGSDPLARVAFGVEYEASESFAAGQTHRSSENFGHAVVPTLYGIEADGDPQLVTHLRYALSRGGSEFWGGAFSIDVALQWCVYRLLADGRCYLFVHYTTDAPVLTERVSFLATETIARRRRNGREIFEQYVSEYADRGSGDRWHEFDASEVVSMSWPLKEPGGRKPPARQARRIGRDLDRLWAQSHYELRGGANPDDTLLPLLRARSGAYGDVLERIQDLEDELSDVLFDVPLQDATEFFASERLCRQREAAAEVRAYLLACFNEQWLARWSQLNGWGQAELRFRADLHTAADWRDLRRQLLEGEATIEDVAAALEAERETVKSSDRR